MKAAKAFTLAFLLFTTFLFSQSNTFKLGFTGTLPAGGIVWSATSGTTWSWYNELNFNTWQGFEVGDQQKVVLDKLDNYNLSGMFNPDTVMWAAFGRITVHQAEIGISDRFHYNGYWCGSNYTDNTQFGYGQLVRYFDKNALCNEQNPSGLVLWNANENGEQSFSGLGHDPMYDYGYFDTLGTYYRNLSTWYVKPRMRISVADAFSDPPKNVCKIIIKAYNGDQIGEFIVSTANFRDVSGIGYTGEYLEEFYQREIKILADDLNQGRGTNWTEYQPLLNGNCHVDYQIYWYGEVSFWIDYVKVMNKPAHDFFGTSQASIDLRAAIKRKVQTLYDYDAARNRMNGFYTEEIDYTTLRCLKGVQDFLASEFNNSPKVKIHCLINFWSYTRNLKTRYREADYQMYIDSVRPPALMSVYYLTYNPGPDNPAYYYRQHLPNNISFYDNGRYPLTIIASEESSIAAQSVSPAVYNSYIQRLYDDIADTLYFLNNLARESGIKFYAVPQVSNWRIRGGEGQREPMNSEIGTQICMSICRGAQGIMPFQYQSGYSPSAAYEDLLGSGIYFPPEYETDDGVTYFYGMTDIVIPEGLWGKYKRDYNFYGEPKWNYVKELYAKIKIWGPVLANSTTTEGFSVHLDGANHNYISDILSIDPHQTPGTQNPCTNDYQTAPYQNGPYFDCPDERYWEMGFFSTAEPNTKYFMMVNRRSVPATPNSNPPVLGDNRVLKIKFNPVNLPGPVNWKITEVGNSSIGNEVVFSKNYNGYVDLVSTNGGMGWFKPGEGKLFKLEPAVQSGGGLVKDEVINGGEYICSDTVYNNGHNITIGANTTIHFNDSSKFVMNGGIFTAGNQNVLGSQNITSDAVTGSSWHGNSFTNCEVKIYGATFSGLANDTTYAVNIIDCPVVDIRGCTFNTNNSLKGGINAVYYSSLNANITNIYIGGNTFNGTGSTIPTVNVSSYAGVTTPLIIENNTFTEGNTAIFLSGVTGGAIKGNTITDNYIGINALTSSIDISENTISSTLSNSMGIFASGGSELKMNSSGSKELGGHNSISNEGTGTNNINVDGSYFLLDGGENIFNINDQQTSYHLYGYFPQLVSGPFDEMDNCFKVSNSPVNPPYNMVTSGYQGSQITFNFTPYLTGCAVTQCENYTVIDLGGGVYDTICSGSVGSGGSMKEALPLAKGEYSRGFGREGVGKQTTPSGYAGHPSLLRRGAFTPQFAKEKYDSVCVLMRYRNYSQAKTKCLDLINTYPDSVQSLNAVSKLFLATVATDTTYNAANGLKIYYEELILNHSGNTSLVKRANYYILKCKVRMRQYSQALAGFQQIINQNPYSYEGLIARWDYMATSLLIQGQGGSYSSIDNDQLTMNNISDESYEFDKFEELGDDKNPFTKEQRQDIRKSINTAIDISKNNDETKMKTLEVKSDLGDVTASRELTQMKSLKQVVKTEKPKSITEHIKIVSEDIRKVFGSNTSGKGNEPKNLPTVFRISQNYPNPFNPTTKINYDLPKDSKVNIVIYDILGREVKRLVNNEIKQAGSYIVDFNASNYASGVYFYRIEAEEPNGNKFVDSKKMVLLK